MRGVALLSMPFGAHRIPKLSLALLKGYLKNDAVKCDIHLFDLALAFRIGLDNYEIIAERFDPSLLIGDWFFSEELFGADPETDRKYINLLLSDISKKKDTVILPGVLKLLEIRDKMPAYLKECLNSVDWSKYRIVGFSTSNQQNCACLALAKLIKKSYPDIKIVFGGSNCFGVMAEAMLRSFSFIDFVCKGEGDISFPLLVKDILRGKPVEPGSIPGVLCRSKNAPDITYKEPVSVEDLDTSAIPDFKEYFSYLKEKSAFNDCGPQIPVEASRGCWWRKVSRCTFCGHCFDTDMVFRSKSPERVVGEIKYLSGKYSNFFRFSDDIMDYNYYKTLLPELVKQKTGASFMWEVKANITKEQMAVLSDAGVKRIQPGIESLDDNTLKLINKGTTRLINISTLKWAKEFDVHTYWNLLYGFPGEDHLEYEKVIELIPLLYHLDPPFGFSHIRFERFSSYIDDPASFGIKSLKPSSVYGYIYRGLDKSNINDLAFYFDAEYEDSSKKYEEKLFQALEEWRLRTNAALDVFSYNDSIKIVDTRKPEDECEFFFKGLKAGIYLFCDKTRSLSSILEAPEIADEAAEGEIKGALGEFIKEGLMIESGGRYLSLAVMR